MKRFLPLVFGLSLLFSSSAWTQSIELITQAGVLPPLPEDRLQPLVSPADFDALVAAASGKRIVMLGESTHGTQEFYVWRDLLSRRLLDEQGFNLILVEGDFASLYEVNRYIRHQPGAARSARQLLEKLDRWPQWMWGNEETVALVEWLRRYNADKPAHARVGFYGMDVYDEWRAYRSLLTALRKQDRRLHRGVARHYDCLKPYVDKSWDYARAVRAGSVNCANAVDQVVALLQDEQPSLAKLTAAERFYLQQNARVVQGAERYFRIALNASEGERDSWNARVDFMQQTLEHLLTHYGEQSRAIVWAHNSHVGDARFTTMLDSGHRNIGQLAREHWGDEAVLLVGFASYEGRTIAALAWGDFLAAMRLPPARPGSVEAWLAGAKVANFYWVFDESDRSNAWYLEPRGHRAVGVVYSPAHDANQYEPSVLPRRYDALVFFRLSQPLTPVVVPRR